MALEGPLFPFPRVILTHRPGIVSASGSFSRLLRDGQGSSTGANAAATLQEVPAGLPVNNSGAAVSLKHTNLVVLADVTENVI